MSDIDIGQFAEAINDKTDRDLRNVDTTAKADAVIDYQMPTAENGYTWYRKYKSGWVEQGGYVVSDGTTDQRVALPIEMGSNIYCVSTKSKSSVATRPSDTSSANHNTVFFYNKIIYNQTTTGFNIGSSTEMSIVGTYWQVSGMAAI